MAGYSGHQDRGQGAAHKVYQPLLFPDEVWAVWEHPDAYGRRLTKALRSKRPDAAPPGWVPAPSPTYNRDWGVGVAGVIEEERK